MWTISYFDSNSSEFGSVHLFLFLIYTSVLSDLSVIKEKVSAVDEPCAGVSSVGGRPNRPNHSRPIHGSPIGPTMAGPSMAG